MSDELKVGDWVRNKNYPYHIGPITKIEFGRISYSLREPTGWDAADSLCRATYAEIAAATGQPQEEKIEVGDTVELLNVSTDPEKWKRCIIEAQHEYIKEWWTGRTEAGTVWSWSKNNCRLVSKGKSAEVTIRCGDIVYPIDTDGRKTESVLRVDSDGMVETKTWRGREQDFRVVSKGKSGQGENQKPAQPEKYPSHKPTGCTCSATAHPPCSWCESEHHCEECESADELVHTEKGRVLCETCFAKVACPACGGSGRQHGFSDTDTVPCGKCQYGKLKPEPVIAKPYHKVLPSGECVLRTSVESHWNAVIECDKCGQSVIHSWRVQEGGKIFCNDCDEERQEDEKDAARAALEKAQAEAKRLGIL